jgi:hypothetical protein
MYEEDKDRWVNSDANAFTGGRTIVSSHGIVEGPDH